MDNLVSLAYGFSQAMTPINIAWAFLGCFVGTAIGVLPGIGPALTIAVLLPITAQVPASAAFIFFAGIYYGAGYGGSTTSILLNIPGESSTVITAIEGHQMALNGRAGPALATAAIGSFVAGTIGTVALTVFGPLVAQIGLKFGPTEMFAIMIFAFMTSAAVLGNSMLRGLASLGIGLSLGIVGVDLQTGQSRLTFGVPELLDGIDVIMVAVALFAVAETLHTALLWRPDGVTVIKPQGAMWLTRRDWQRSWKPWLRGAAVGFPLGALPLGGGEIPTFVSYALEKRLSKRPDKFGRGAIEGVAGPEAANNAAGAGVLVPMLTLGLPTSTTAALLLTAFQNYGIQPGPFLFATQGPLIWTLIASLYIGNVILLVLNLPLISLWVRILRIPPHHFFAGVLIFVTIGVYGISGSIFDVALLYLIGGIGLVMRRYGFPPAPVIIGLVLGPLLEQSFRQSIAIGQGDPGVFLSRPIACALLVVALIIPILIGIMSLINWIKQPPVGVDSGS
ncbi:tripartite tricarboxylate transporter permease [Mesorhizobium sp. CGMCC 1.15528]|uniref:Tripartite tricarboxylate transporter permease n=1 Tax=Mesorhizobium zhangyense TaxID=1776730 RepID=A0A7C9RBS2_9HYPH|nr:tripartite tricarboxylate transporter permease [Mesorhizobium zhangyense]NGN45162.1 tripartite tricarboxylate transporter permease [Mesorhizobium zhangyense]